MSKALWKGLDCKDLKSPCDNLGAVYSTDVDGEQLYEKVLLQNASLKLCNLKLSRPEVLTFFELLCK